MGVSQNPSEYKAVAEYFWRAAVVWTSTLYLRLGEEAMYDIEKELEES